MIDLRSDTVTRPGAAMRDAMFNAELGDDVYGDDPTVNRLEEIAADMLAMESSLFVPSGTQSNLVALLAHCQRGDEYIVGHDAHTYKYEGGGAAALGGIQPQTVPFDDAAELPLDQVEAVIKDDDFHFARTRLLALENTQHGRVVSIDYIKQARKLCDKHSLVLHLDGARVFNAAVKMQVPVSEISRHFDSVSVCLSKGLGSPVGSVLCGSVEFIEQARRWRKVTGGGMRQAGLLAAAGLVSLQTLVERLADDHANAEQMQELLRGTPGVTVREAWTQTNMVWLDLQKPADDGFVAYARDNGVLLSCSGQLCRLVMHLDVSSDDVSHAAQVIRSWFEKNG